MLTNGRTSMHGRPCAKGPTGCRSQGSLRLDTRELGVRCSLLDGAKIMERRFNAAQNFFVDLR